MASCCVNDFKDVTASHEVPQLVCGTSTVVFKLLHPGVAKSTSWSRPCVVWKFTILTQWDHDTDSSSVDLRTWLKRCASPMCS